METEKEKISVIIPVYNVEKYLKRCLDSVINQTYKNLEIILIDDGSTDNSGKICDEYAEKDKRVKLFSQINQGAGAARNFGLAIANGNYIVFIDPDDFYPDKNVLNDLYEAIKYNNVFIAGGGLIEFLSDYRYRFKYKKNDPRVFDADEIMIYRNYQYDYFFQRFIYSKEFLRKNNIKFSLHKRQQDIIFFVNAMIKAEKFYAMKRRTYCYYVNYKFNKLDKNKIQEYIDASKLLLNISLNANLKQLYTRTRKRFLFQCFEKVLIKLNLNEVQYLIHKYCMKFKFKLFLDSSYVDDIRTIDKWSVNK